MRTRTSARAQTARLRQDAEAGGKGTSEHEQSDAARHGLAGSPRRLALRRHGSRRRLHGGKSVGGASERAGPGLVLGRRAWRAWTHAVGGRSGRSGRSGGGGGSPRAVVVVVQVEAVVVVSCRGRKGWKGGESGA